MSDQETNVTLTTTTLHAAMRPPDLADLRTLTEHWRVCPGASRSL
jgi:hypothetical protein